MAKEKFGGYKVDFKGDKRSLEDVFGKTPLSPSEMTKKLWNHIKSKKLGKK